MKILKLILLLVCVTSFAQETPTTKVGTVDVDYILSLMPELAGVQKQVEDYGATLNVELEKKLTGYQALIDDYKANEVTYTIAQKQKAQDSIVSVENDINTFRQNAPKLASLKQEEYLQPLYQKIGDALQKVAEAEGYTQVLLRDNRVVFIDNRLDLTLTILGELGIEPPAEGTDGN